MQHERIGSSETVCTNCFKQLTKENMTTGDGHFCSVSCMAEHKRKEEQQRRQMEQR